MSKKLLSILLALAISLSLAVPALAADAPTNHWAQDAVDALNRIYGSGIFSADDNEITESDAYTVLHSMGASTAELTSDSNTKLTRAKACTVLATIFKLPLGNKTAIQYLYEQNIVNGKSEGELNENGTITKAQFAVLAYRILNAVGGGKGSATALKPGTEEYFAWMYLAARSCVPFDTAADVINNTAISAATISTLTSENGDWSNVNHKEDKTGEELWNAWYDRLNALHAFTKPAYNASEILGAAAIRMVKAMTDANGSPYIFSDVTPTSEYFWAYDGLMYLFDHRIVNGTGNGTFVPEGSMARFQLAVLLARLDNYQSNSADPNQGLLDNITYAVTTKGYMTGTVPTGDVLQDSEWGRNSQPTRQETVTAILKQQGVDVTGVNASILDRFIDANKVTEANKPYMAYAVSRGLINGTSKNTLAPDDACNRAQMGVLLYRFLVGLDTSKMHDYEENVSYVLPATETTGG